MVFTWNTTAPDIPRLTDILNNSSGPANIARTLTYAWVWAFGGWFFAIVLSGLAAALYIKFHNSMVPVVFLLVMTVLFEGVFSAVPLGLPDAGVFVYIVVSLAAFSIGFMLFRLFIGKR